MVYSEFRLDQIEAVCVGNTWYDVAAIDYVSIGVHKKAPKPGQPPIMTLNDWIEIETNSNEWFVFPWSRVAGIRLASWKMDSDEVSEPA